MAPAVNLWRGVGGTVTTKDATHRHGMNDASLREESGRTSYGSGCWSPRTSRPGPEPQPRRAMVCTQPSYAAGKGPGPATLGTDAVMGLDRGHMTHI